MKLQLHFSIPCKNDLSEKLIYALPAFNAFSGNFPTAGLKGRKPISPEPTPAEGRQEKPNLSRNNNLF